MTPTIGRSHGIHAEPVTFGLKLAQAYAEFARCRARLVAARAEVATCAISGAVGTYANIDPAIEAHVAEKLGLTAEPISTQVIPRDRHAMFFATLGVVASCLERLAIEIRHLQRTEVLEAEEFSPRGRRGRPRCRTSAIPSSPRMSRVSLGWCAAWPCRRWRTSRCGMSAISRIPRSSA